MNLSIRHHFSLDRLVVASITFALTWGSMASASAAATPYQLPLLGVSPVAPNVIFTLDDSGSMLSPLMPDSLTSDKADGNCCNVQTMAAEEVVTQYDYNTNEKAYGLIPTRMPNRPAAEYLADARRRSSQSNTIYYNPNERYEPWTNSDGTLRAFPTAANTTNWTKVPTEGSSTLTNLTPRALGSTTNSSTNTTKWCLTIDTCDSRSTYAGNAPELNAAADYDPTVYYILDNATTPTAAGTVRVSIWNMKTYTTATPSGTSVGSFTVGSNRTDCTALPNGMRSCSQAQELQNFATWYRYHRTRLMLAKASASKAFSSPDVTGFRLGWGALNNPGENDTIALDGTNTKTLRQGVRNYTTTHRDAFYTWLFNKDANSGTPLRRAVDDVGKYFSREDSKGPWADEPGTSNTQTAGSYAACRRAFHILTTDGYWSSDSASGASTAGAQADVESVDGPTITGPNAQTYQYKASASTNTRYKDGVANMLADVAMYYWNRDITPGIANKITPTAANEAFWQHMVNYTVGLGVSGRLKKNPSDLPDIEAIPQKKTWQTSGTTATNATDDAKADDLWHAAYNSRGQNINVTTSGEFATALQAILTDIAAESNKTAGVGLTGAILGTDAAKYVPEYTSRDWTGDLKKFVLNQDTGTAATTATWSAASKLPAYTARNILIGTGTGSGVNGPASAEAKDFALASLTSAMIAEMSTTPTVNDNLIQYLRGNNTDTFLSTNNYRQRSSLLGDIVNSTPLYVKSGIDYQYNVLSGDAGNTYRDFLKTMAKRDARIFVGANDGMMHVLSDSTGAEVFAYIPRAVTSNLNKLADKNYGHRFFVDGPATEAHAYWGGTWKSVVLGTMGSGGKGVFAINATSPSALADKSTAASQVLWELNGGNTDLGYIYGEVETGPINYNGTTVWVALVNNGYYSNSNKAKLLVVDISNGRILKTIDTNRGSDAAPNGLGGVRAVRNASGLIVAAYAGDAQGNVWRFDLNSASATNWQPAYGGNPLFIAKDPDNTVQPITAAPAIVAHPRGGNLIVVASGKLIDEADRPGVSTAASQVQSIYGLWDKQFASVTTTSDQASANVISGKGALVQQVINTTPVATSADGRTYYAITTTLPNWSTQRGWYLNMTLATGQRVVYSAQSYQGRVLLGSVVPTTSTSCGSASAFNFYLDALTGNANSKVLIDTNGDGVLDGKDAANAAVYSGANDGRDRIVVRERQRAAGAGGAGGNGPDACEGAQIISATNNKTQCVQGGDLVGSRTWRILTNPPRIGDQLK
ncbi:MAG TPA: hypothetical protein H9903_10885 [Candidatus Aquabacterium excrementipullorum]|nr:hypothetical protein [Candidatus Aquabacterium excrementipullorum]